MNFFDEISKDYKLFPMYFVSKNAQDYYAVLSEEDRLKTINKVIDGDCINVPFEKMIILTNFIDASKKKTKIHIFVESPSPSEMVVTIFYNEKMQAQYSVVYDKEKRSFKLRTTTEMESLFKNKFGSNYDSEEVKEEVKKIMQSQQGNTLKIISLIMHKNLYRYIENTNLGNKKRFGRVITNQVVHVYKNKNLINKLSKNGTIDFKHSFAVCGHWRKVPSIGKNRNGQYVIEGFTWIDSFTKGSGIFIQKSRVIKELA